MHSSICRYILERIYMCVRGVHSRIQRHCFYGSSVQSVHYIVCVYLRLPAYSTYNTYVMRCVLCCVCLAYSILQLNCGDIERLCLGMRWRMRDAFVMLSALTPNKTNFTYINIYIIQSYMRIRFRSKRTHTHTHMYIEKLIAF